MDLDSFLISILFDNAKTNDSARKIENTINNLKDKIVTAFASIASIDFLKNAIESSIKLSTQLDNLSYITNISKENLNAWGESVKRNGGSAEGFYSSISSLSEKIREMQTNFGSAGQLVFARLGINIRDSAGHIRNAIDILGEVGDKFKNLPKVWQQNLGQQLGLDPATIRLISNGNAEAQKLVENMMKLGSINELNTERNIKFRNSLYDLELIWQSIKLTIANALIPIIQQFSELLIKAMLFLKEHTTAIKVVLLVLSSILTGVLLTAIISATSALLKMAIAMAVNPIVLITTALIGLGLVIQDFIVYLRGGNAEFAKFYDMISDESIKSKIGELGDYIKEKFKPLINMFKELKDTYKYFTSSPDEYQKYLDDEKINEEKENSFSNDAENNPKNSIQDKITNTARNLGFDPSIANSIANIESGFDPNAKNSNSSASGLFGLTNETAQSNGITNLSQKNNIAQNIIAGIMNLKKVSSGLTKFFNRSPTGSETYLGEMLGLEGAKSVFSANSNTMLSSLFNSSVLNANPQFKTMTAGQLINNANKTYQQKSVTVGEVNINAPNSNAQEISKKIGQVMQQHFSNLVTNIDNGILA